MKITSKKNNILFYNDGKQQVKKKNYTRNLSQLISY